MNIYKFVVDVNSVGIRLDKYLTQQFLAIKPEITRSKIQNFCEQNLIVDEADRPVNPPRRVRGRSSATHPDPD